MTFSLSKQDILKGNESFNQIFKQGKTFSSQYFIAYVTQDKPFKIGFAVQKGYRNKPERNRIKRITRELMRTNYENFNLLHQMVIISRIKVLSVKYEILEEDFIQLLIKIKEEQFS